MLTALVGRIVLIAVVSVGMSGAAAEASAADPWGDTDGGTADTGAHPDGAHHTWCESTSVSPDSTGGISAAMFDAVEPTGARADYQSDCRLTDSLDAETDIVWRDGNLSSGTSGETYCQSWNGGVNECDQYYSTLDPDEIRVGSYDEIDFDQTACHEAGHALGLTHGGWSDDCMINSAATPPTALRYRRYGAHHKVHIEDWFND